MENEELNKSKLIINLTGNSLNVDLEPLIKKEVPEQIILIGEDAAANTIATMEALKKVTNAEIIVLNDLKDIRKKTTLNKIGIVGAGGAYEQELIKVLDQMHQRDLDLRTKPLKFTNPYAEPTDSDYMERKRRSAHNILHKLNDKQIAEEYSRIKEKKSNLSRSERDAIVKFFENK